LVELLVGWVGGQGCLYELKWAFTVPGFSWGRYSHWGDDHERKWNNLNLVAAANLYPATSPPLMHGEALRDGESHYLHHER
jgi:hypothetical protein